MRARSGLTHGAQAGLRVRVRGFSNNLRGCPSASKADCEPTAGRSRRLATNSRSSAPRKANAASSGPLDHEHLSHEIGDVFRIQAGSRASTGVQFLICSRPVMGPRPQRVPWTYHACQSIALSRKHAAGVKGAHDRNRYKESGTNDRTRTAASVCGS
jgi:hypothetical protein